VWWATRTAPHRRGAGIVAVPITACSPVAHRPTHDDITARLHCLAAFNKNIVCARSPRPFWPNTIAKSATELNTARLRHGAYPDMPTLIDNPVSAAPGVQAWRTSCPWLVCPRCRKRWLSAFYRR